MKLQTKVLIALVGGLLVTYIGASWLQKHFNTVALERFSRESLSKESDRQWQWIQCLNQAVDSSLVDAMSEGEMEKFAKILAAQRKVPGLQELSLTDADGRIAYSTDKSRENKKLPEDVFKQVSSSRNELRRRTDTSFELYKPLMAEASCIECHVAWKPEQVCGIMHMKFSSDPLKAAEQGWGHFQGQFEKSSMIIAGITILVLMAVVTGICLLVIRRLVALPLRNICSLLSAQAQEVAGAAGQVSTASQSLAEGASEQAASLEETSASLEEIASMTKNNSENTAHANDLTRQAHKAADTGSKDVQSLSSAMEAIKASSGDITKIIQTINEIAFQTNILALNAAVEAARAGEAGMGFAVVADEVRNLAQRSAEAARETATKIEGAIARTGQGVEISSKVATALNDIVTKVRQVDELVAQVSGSSREQTQGITQINTAVGQMDKVTQNNAASAEESAAAAEELNAQAETMKQSVAQLFRLVEGENQKAYANAPAPERKPFASAARLPAKPSTPSPGRNRGPAKRTGDSAPGRKEPAMAGVSTDNHDFQDF